MEENTSIQCEVLRNKQNQPRFMQHLTVKHFQKKAVSKNFTKHLNPTVHWKNLYLMLHRLTESRNVEEE